MHGGLRRTRCSGEPARSQTAAGSPGHARPSDHDCAGGRGGIAVFIASISTYESLRSGRDRFYASARFPQEYRFRTTGSTPFSGLTAWRIGVRRGDDRQLSGRRRRPLKGSPPSATQWPHEVRREGSVRQGYLVHQRVGLLLLTFERQMIG
jgi:hypothetical protein